MAFFLFINGASLVTRLLPRKMSNNLHGSGVYTSPRKNRTVPAQSKILTYICTSDKIKSVQGFVRTLQTGSKSSLTALIGCFIISLSSVTNELLREIFFL